MNINVIISSHLHADVKALVVPNDDETYTILVNSRLSRESAIAAIVHEVMHIQRNDFSNEEHTTLLESLIRYNDCSTSLLNEYNFFWSYD